MTGQTRRTWTLCAGLLLSFMLAAGCATQESKPQQTAPPPPPPKSKAPAPAPAVKVADGRVNVSMAFPSAVRGVGGKECCGVVVIDKSAPAEVAVGQSFDYIIKATNKGDVEVRKVVVTDELPGGFTFASSNPQATSNNGGVVTWNLGALSPGQSKTIKVTGSATGTGKLINCATVDFVPYICVATNVVQPALKLTKSAPAQVMLCDTIPVKIVVTNTGTGAAKNVVVTDVLPGGLKTTDGKSQVKVDVGTLAAGQSREVTLNLKAAKAGNYTNTASATGSGNLSAKASSATKVVEPKLAITKTAPKLVYLGRNVNYKITVSNTGSGDARNTVVEDTLPANAKLVSASDGGQASGGKVVWNLGTLKPNDTRTLSVSVKGDTKGTLLNKAVASATCAGSVADSAQTDVKGIPAILLEVIDVNDPVEVGSEETYIITATNQGSKVGTNVQITCTLEAAQQYVSSGGATNATVKGQVVTFAPLPELAPGAKASWKVVVKAVKAGDIRFSVQMTEDQLTRPVNETEATNQYE